MNILTAYQNSNGTKLEVIRTGKTFITRRYYPATKHSAAEKVERKHRTYSPVEKMIVKFGFEPVGVDNA